MKEIEKKESLEYWSTQIEGWKKSGLTRQVYCEHEGINYKKFLYQLSRTRKIIKKPLVHFIEAPIQIRKEPSVLSGVEVRLPNGICIGLGEMSCSLLEGILSYVGSLKC